MATSKTHVNISIMAHGGHTQSILLHNIVQFLGTGIVTILTIGSLHYSVDEIWAGWWPKFHLNTKNYWTMEITDCKEIVHCSASQETGLYCTIKVIVYGPHNNTLSISIGGPLDNMPYCKSDNCQKWFWYKNMWDSFRKSPQKFNVCHIIYELSV